MKSTHALSIAAAALALGLAAPASSQNCGPGIGPCGGTGYGPGHGAGMMMGGEARLDALRSQLVLQPSQQGAWDAYAATVRALAQDMAEHRAQMRNDAGPAPERAARRAQVMAEHAAAHAKVAEALKGLYAVLDAGQRAILDRHSTPMYGPFAGR
jgi:hypothetical protein